MDDLSGYISDHNISVIILSFKKFRIKDKADIEARLLSLAVTFPGLDQALPVTFTFVPVLGLLGPAVCAETVKRTVPDSINMPKSSL